MQTNETIKMQFKQPQIMCTDELANKKLLLVLFNYNANFVENSINRLPPKRPDYYVTTALLNLITYTIEQSCESKHY